MYRKLFSLTAISLLSVTVTLAQCKYDIEEKDVITGATVFKTKKISLSKGAKKKKTYSTGKITVRFEKTSDENILLLEYKVLESFGKPLMYIQGKDQLIIRYEDNSTETIDMVKAPSIAVIGGAGVTKLSFALTEKLMENLNKGNGIAAIRITSMMFDIDAGDLETNLVEEFKQCWVN